MNNKQRSEDDYDFLFKIVLIGTLSSSLPSI